MGHCISCFKIQTNNGVGISQNIHKDEMTENVTANPVATDVSIYPQEEPLLCENENSINSDKKVNDQQNITVSSFGEGNTGDIIESQKMFSKSNIENKAHKPFYHILPSIQRSVPLLESTDSHISDTKIHLLFDQYKDSSEDAILTEGIENLCNDLKLNPDDFKVLVLAWKLNASQMCKFTRDEFFEGLKSLGTDSVKGIQHKLNEVVLELTKDTEQFKELYRFTFKFGLDASVGQRILPTDIAVVLWRLVFINNEPPILDRWLNYIEKNSHIRGIPKDTWYMFLNFCEYVGNDLSTYDDTEAWPSLFDDFVEYENDQTNQNITKNDIKIQE